jgi:hypothetical protein
MPHGVSVCSHQAFDCTRKITYQNLTEWYKELRIYCESIPVIVVANKIDVDYNVRAAQCRAAWLAVRVCFKCAVSSLTLR